MCIFFPHVCGYRCAAVAAVTMFKNNSKKKTLQTCCLLPVFLRGRALLKSVKIHVNGSSYRNTHPWASVPAHTRTHTCTHACTHNARNSCSIFEWVQSESMSNQCRSFSLSTAVWKTEHMLWWIDNTGWELSIIYNVYKNKGKKAETWLLFITFDIWGHIKDINNPNQNSF